MPHFLTAHITTCMTRQAIDRLVRRLSTDSTDGVKCLRAWGDTVAGRLVCRWEAPDDEALTAWLAERNIRFRGSEEWLMKVQIELGSD